MRDRLLFFAACVLLLAACGSENNASTVEEDLGITPANNDTGDNNNTSSGPVCGNGFVEGDEVCDGNCPELADCPLSGSACLAPQLNGAAENCDATCSLIPITACTDDDGCCPDECDASSDSDCAPPMCGDDVVEGDENCDGDCPTDPDFDCPEPVVACTVAVITGEACQAMCATERITACADDDGCCPLGCTNADDTDCPEDAMCGNGVVEPGESCDGLCPQDTSSCPRSGAACQQAALTGSADECTAACVFVTITMCADDDGCCPAACTAANDSDC